MVADIRRARASDVDALLAIENAVFQTDRLSRQSLRRLIGRPSATVLVADIGGEVAGYCIVLLRAGSATARLYSVSTAPDMAGQGIGRALVQAAEAAAVAEGKRFLRLEVRQDNTRAVSIYERAGFRRIGSKSDYYQDGMTALRMEKPLIASGSAARIGNGNATFATSGSLSRLAEQTSRRASR
ncbi:GNAT family N-acetyltransferase [Mesorhizobium sp. KR9-304]|uniref:GNAT family N-acetyltransferase n=1 Tax=Mesorhizobium sp. KR9-304 TaxID=3156614 RepID=UPI0032B5599B